MNKITKINSIQYAYRKIILQSNQNNIIYEGWVGNLIDKTKAGLKKVKDAAVNFVGALGKWLKSLWGLIKFGVLVLTRSVSGTYKSNPNQYTSDSNQLQTNLYVVLPFFKKPMSVIDNAGQETHKKEYKQLKESLKGSKDKVSNVDNSSKNMGKALWQRAKGPFIESVKSSTSEAKEMGKQLEKKSEEKTPSQKPTNTPAQTTATDNTKKQSEKTQQEKAQSTQLTTEDLNIINQQAIKYQHDLHELIIDWVYKGLTPKVIMQHIDNDLTNRPQGKIIIENNLLSFKTHNGELICQEINLDTKDTIIYESNCKFKGHHLIYEDTENKYKKFNNIITQEDEEDYNKIITEQIGIFQIMTIVSIVMTIVGVISLIKHVILAPLHAATCGVSAAASEGTKPVQAGGGTVAGNATVMGTQQAGKAVAKKSATEILKQAGHAVKQQGLKEVAKNTAKEMGKQAIAHPMSTISNIHQAKSIGDQIATTAKGPAGAINDAMKDVKIDNNMANNIDIKL